MNYYILRGILTEHFQNAVCISHNNNRLTWSLKTYCTYVTRLNTVSVTCPVSKVVHIQNYSWAEKMSQVSSNPIGRSHLIMYRTIGLTDYYRTISDWLTG